MLSVLVRNHGKEKEDYRKHCDCTPNDVEIEISLKIKVSQSTKNICIERQYNECQLGYASSVLTLSSLHQV